MLLTTDAQLYFSIVIISEFCSFIFQIVLKYAHESCCLRRTEEHLDYSAQSLRLIYTRCFPTAALAKIYAHHPDKIANRIYADRFGNGDEASGDGWRFHGRGLILLSGRKLYGAFCKALDCQFMSHPEMLAQDPFWAVTASAWLWQYHQLNRFADQDDLESITRIISGDYNGLAERAHFLPIAKAALGLAQHN